MVINPLSIVEIGGRLLDKIIPDKDAREKAQAELIKAAQDQNFQRDMAQIELNKEEAKMDLFRGGWRPAVGWTCGIAFALHFVIFPLLNFFLAAVDQPQITVAFDMDTLMTVLMGLLGLGGLRTVEKWKGIN
jgi:hypothetical protein